MTIKVNTSYELPYVGGCSRDGKVIYIDKNYPRFFTALNGHKYLTHQALATHEQAEARYMISGKLTYNRAHEEAIVDEIEYLTQEKIPIDEYYGFLYLWVRKNLDDASKGKKFNLPPDLHLLPYQEDGLMWIIRQSVK